MGNVPSRKSIELVRAMVSGSRPESRFISIEQAEIMLARGQAYVAEDGTRRIFERSVKPRGEHREWRKTRCYDPDTRSSVSTMQLVPVGSQRTRRVS